MDIFVLAVDQYCLSIGSPDIADPLSIFSQHRDQVALSVDHGENQWKGDSPPGFSPDHFQCHQPVGSNTCCMDDGPAPIQSLGNPIGPIIVIQPTLEVVITHSISYT